MHRALLRTVAGGKALWADDRCRVHAAIGAVGVDEIADPLARVGDALGRGGVGLPTDPLRSGGGAVRALRVGLIADDLLGKAHRPATHRQVVVDRGADLLC